ncbi:MAG: potassium channel family protein [Paracoccaceae bacterium]
MRFTNIFLHVFLSDLAGLTPVIIVLVTLIVAAGVIVGRLERWRLVDSIYQALITATTVGYGELYPTRNLSKFLCVMNAFIGLLLIGIIVATGVHAVEIAYQGTR